MSFTVPQDWSDWSGHPLQCEKEFLKRNFAKNILVHAAKCFSCKFCSNALSTPLIVSQIFISFRKMFINEKQIYHDCRFFWTEIKRESLLSIILPCFYDILTLLKEYDISEFELSFDQGKGKLVRVSKEFELSELS